MTENLELRTATADEFAELFTFVSGVFLSDADDEALDVERLVSEPDRFHVITDGGRPVGTGGVLTRDLTVPGAVVPAAHVTAVSVAPTHRRRGLLTRIMDAQLGAVRDRGTEPIAVLWASEGAIYGRFGYGMAACHVNYTIPTLETHLPGAAPAGNLRAVTPSEVTDELAGVYERMRTERPGVSSRPGRWWEHLTADPKERRRGMSALRGVVCQVDDEVCGYALWRVKGGWGEAGPEGEVAVRELVAVNPEAYAALWRFVLSIDLVRKVSFMYAAVDEPLPHLLTNPFALSPSTGQSLWVRVVDVPAALAARRYRTPVDLVVEVDEDAQLPGNAGRWHLIGDESSAKCERTDVAPNVSLTVRDLGAIYLGGTSLQTLADAGLVAEHSDGAIRAASAAFGWHRAPASIEIF